MSAISAHKSHKDKKVLPIYKNSNNFEEWKCSP